MFSLGLGDKLPKFSNKLLTTEQSSGIDIGLRKVLQQWKLFRKTSINAREQPFAKSVDKKSVLPYEL